jgi:PTH1 family peptidyl-tRNA hydrolase
LLNINLKEERFSSLKPNTYMNLSGKAVQLLDENIPLENILVITDDLNLSFGTIRIKPKEVMAAITD